MGDLNFNNLFIGISIEQIVVLLVLVVVSILFGLMAGASIFYPLGYRRCRKDGRAGSRAPAPQQQQQRPAPAPQQQRSVAAVAAPVTVQRAVVDTFDAQQAFTDEDLLDLEDLEEEEETVAPQIEQPVAVVEDVAPTEEAQGEDARSHPEPQTEEMVQRRTPVDAIVEESMVVPALVDVAPGVGEQIQVEGEPLRDEVFVRMEAERKAQVTVMNHNVLLNYCVRMTPLATELPIRILPRDAQHAFDRIQVKDYTFAVVFEYSKVLRLVLRLHANTVGALRRAAGKAVEAAPQYGEDWYAWVITDLEHCEKLVAKVLDMSYKYVAHATYMRGKDNDFVPKVESYEQQICDIADAYDPEEDRMYMALSKAMNAKYQLHYFSRSVAAQVATGIEGPLTVTVEEPNNCMAVLKAGGYMFAVVYESYGVVKILFCADKEYVDVLREEHPYVGYSKEPSSRYHQWYYAILDNTFNDEQSAQLLSTAYQHMVALVNA